MIAACCHPHLLARVLFAAMDDGIGQSFLQRCLDLELLSRDAARFSRKIEDAHDHGINGVNPGRKRDVKAQEERVIFKFADIRMLVSHWLAL